MGTGTHYTVMTIQFGVLVQYTSSLYVHRFDYGSLKSTLDSQALSASSSGTDEDLTTYSTLTVRVLDRTVGKMSVSR